MSDVTPDDEKEIEKLKEALHLNLAMCYIKLDEWSKAKASCDSALEISVSVKGLFRRAQARERQRLFDDALADCKQAAALDPENKSVAKLQASCQAKVRSPMRSSLYTTTRKLGCSGRRRHRTAPCSFRPDPQSRGLMADGVQPRTPLAG